MSQRDIVIAASLLGAVVGGAVAYLALTDRGRQTGDRLENWLEQAMREIGRLSRIAQQVQRIAANSSREWERWGGAAQQQAGNIQ
jgi:hypothetical protein